MNINQCDILSFYTLSEKKYFDMIITIGGQLKINTVIETDILININQWRGMVTAMKYQWVGYHIRLCKPEVIINMINSCQKLSFFLVIFKSNAKTTAEMTAYFVVSIEPADDLHMLFANGEGWQKFFPVYVYRQHGNGLNKQVFTI